METAVEIAADVAEAVIIDKRNKRKKKIEQRREIQFGVSGKC